MRRRLVVGVVVVGLMLSAAGYAYARVGPAAPDCGAAASEAEALSTAAVCGRPVVVESSRSEYVQVLAQPDGRLTFESAVVPQRARRSDGSWADVDLTLRAGDDGLLRPETSVADVAFSGGGSAPLVSLRRGGKSMVLSWPGALPVPVISGESATYTNVLPDVDLVVRATRTGFTHVLVVKTKAAAANPAVRTISLGVGGDARVEALPDGALQAVVGGTVLARAQPAVMWDSSRPSGAQVAPESDTRSSAAGAGDGARMAAVATRVAGDRLELMPDVTLLDGDGAFPVFVDPPWDMARSRWAYATNTNCTNNDLSWARVGEAQPGGGPCDGDLFRSYFEFPMTNGQGVSLTGKFIQSAYVRMKLYHSSSCSDTPTNMYLTPVINATPKASWSSMTLAKWLASASGHANKGSCSNQPVVMDMNFMGSAVTSEVQRAASEGWTLFAVGFSARDSNGANESSNDRWKKFYHDQAALVVDYDSKPGQPTQLRVADVACPAGGVGISTLTPTFSAVYPDADTGQELFGHYEWIEVPAGGMGAVTDTFPTRKNPPPEVKGKANDWANPTQAVSGLVNGKRYAFRVTAMDSPYGQWSGWGRWCEFWPDTQMPVAPAVTSGPVAGPGRSVTFTFTTPESDVVKFRYGWSSPPATEITATGSGSKTATVTVTVPRYGKNVLWVRAIDTVGNLGNLGSIEFTVARPSPAVARWGLETYPGQTQAQALADAQPALAGNTPLTATNVSWQSDVRMVGGQTATFSQSGYLSTSGPVLDTTKSYSVAAWVRLGDADPSDPDPDLPVPGNSWTAVGQSGSKLSAFYLGYRLQGGTPRWSFAVTRADNDQNGWGQSLYSTNAVTTADVGRWVHLAGAYDAAAGQLRLYVNGVLAGTAGRAAGSWNATGPVTVGGALFTAPGATPGITDKWRGQIADVQLFDRVLVDQDFTGQLASDPFSGGVDEPGILAPIEVGRWEFELARPCYLQDLADTCDAADGTGFDRWLALTRGSAIGAGNQGNGLQLDGYYFADENPPPWESTVEWGRSAYKAGLTPPDQDGNEHTIWQNTPVLRTDQSLTVSAWVKVNALTDSDQVVLMQGGWPWWSMILNLGGASDKWSFGVSTPNGSGGFTLAVAEANAVATPNVWVHLTGVFDRATGQTRLYVNGVEQTVKGTNGVGWDGTSYMNVGGVWGVGGLFSGSIDQIQVFAGAMTSAQVKSLHDTQVVESLSGL